MEPTTQPSPAERPLNTETVGSAAPEQQPAAAEMTAAAPSAASAVPAGPLPAAPSPVAGGITPATAPAATPAPAAGVATPAVAGDVDVIEKEWVDAAEQVIGKTAGDPHAREEAVEDLQIDYLKKRYGKDVKKS